MAELATKDEVVTLPDGRQVQIQAKGFPVVTELAERERALAERANEEAIIQPFEEIGVDTDVVGLGLVR